VSTLFAGNDFASFEQWREATRTLLQQQLPAQAEPRLPRELMRLLRCLSCYRHPGRWELMTRLTLRCLREGRALLEDVVDADLRHARQMESAVRRDIHKMHAFLRFRELAAGDGSPAYFAWFEPAHQILRRAAPFFVKRFANMHWTIATPDGSACWDRQQLQIIDAPATRDHTAADPHETLWRTYYRSICNVARINPRAMQREMPQRYWAHLPEASEIGTLLRHGREQLARHSVTADIGAAAAARALRRALPAPGPDEALAQCQRCALWRHATQAVPGEGPAGAALMLVGEQPGDEEDLRGRAFVGPAGRLLDELLREAGIERSEAYVTNAVKHFKWEPRGKRRLHRRPDASEITACSGWLQQELNNVRPRVIVALGASAQLSLLGSRESIATARMCSFTHPGGAAVVVTYHPSALLRADPPAAAELRTALLTDLRAAAAAAQSLATHATHGRELVVESHGVQ
jgi:uracil-DNA glycosylase